MSNVHIQELDEAWTSSLSQYAKDKGKLFLNRAANYFGSAKGYGNLVNSVTKKEWMKKYKEFLGKANKKNTVGALQDFFRDAGVPENFISTAMRYAKASNANPGESLGYDVLSKATQAVTDLYARSQKQIGGAGSADPSGRIEPKLNTGSQSGPVAKSQAEIDAERDQEEKQNTVKNVSRELQGWKKSSGFSDYMKSWIEKIRGTAQQGEKISLVKELVNYLADRAPLSASQLAESALWELDLKPKNKSSKKKKSTDDTSTKPASEPPTSEPEAVEPEVDITKDPEERESAAASEVQADAKPLSPEQQALKDRLKKNWDLGSGKLSAHGKNEKQRAPEWETNVTQAIHILKRMDDIPEKFRAVAIQNLRKGIHMESATFEALSALLEAIDLTWLDLGYSVQNNGTTVALYEQHLGDLENILFG